MMWKYDVYKELDDKVIDPFSPNNFSEDIYSLVYYDSYDDCLWDPKKEISEENLGKINISDIFCISLIVLLCITVLLFIVFISIGE